ncbi:cohesin domain-containing protein [Rugamonas violacea]|uniref:cohesin domain-containing protein n=1 Tax=Rugamonas sp. CCM 8940 TaxID=2765359 RepID=UPI00351C43AE
MSAAAAVPLSLQLQAPQELKVGEVFSVQVNVKSTVALRGMPVQLEFSPQTLQVMDAEEGLFFRQDDAAISKTKTLEQANGRASMAVLRNGADGVSGNGTVASFRFKALAAGKAEVRISSARPIAGVAVAPPPLPEASQILVK